MKRILTIILLLTLGLTQLNAQEAQGEGIQFFEGTFEEALAKAKSEGKPLFVDFYAVWCGPCKRIAREVFPQKEVGDYFNEKFISLQLDAEAPENVEVAKRYNVQGFPTLGFIANDGTPIAIHVGALDAKTLLENAKIAIGEAIGFETLYEMHQKDRSDLSIIQDLLTQAPSFLQAQEGMAARRWVVRIQKLYKEYITSKMGPDLINTQDYIIITTLGGDDPEFDAQVVSFVNQNLNAWMDAVGTPAAYYVIEYNDRILEDKAKRGDSSYTENLEKIRGEYKDAYSVIPHAEGVSPYELTKMFYDGLYALFSGKNADEYITKTNDYFKQLGDAITPADYGKAAQNLYTAIGDKLTDEQHKAAIAWVSEALKGDNGPMDRINFIVMIGDSYKALKEYDKAQEYYNQGFVESFNMGEGMEMVQEMIQGTIIRKSAELDLLKQ